MQIITRAEWSARPPKSRVTGDRVTETFLHHSVGYGPGGESYMRIMQNHHMDINGWADIAYNFVVDPGDLRVFEGRGWGVRPGSQKSHNRGTWSVCVMGDYRITQPTQGLLATIAALIRYGAELGHIPGVLTGGHRDAPNQSTTCPGTHLYSRLPAIRNLLEEDDMSAHGPENWDAADWAAFDARAGVAAWAGGYTIFGRHPNTVLRSIEAKVGALDIEGVSEAELDQRVDRLIASLPDAVLARLKLKL